MPQKNSKRIKSVYRKPWLDLTLELESGLWDTVGWCKKQLVNLTIRIILVLLFSKGMGLSLMKNRILRCWDCPFFLNWIRVCTLSLLLELPLGKLHPWFSPWSFFFSGIFYSNPTLYGITVVMPGVVLPISTWIFWISYKTSIMNCWS